MVHRHLISIGNWNISNSPPDTTPPVIALNGQASITLFPLAIRIPKLGQQQMTTLMEILQIIL